MSFLSQLDWRAAVKNFTDEKVSDEKIRAIKKSIQMAPTSFGLQPFFVKIVSDEKTKKLLQEASYGQPQVGNASHVLVFCMRTDVENLLENYLETASGGNPEKKASLQKFSDVVHGFIGNKTEAEISEWANNQVHLVHGFALAACAELSVNSCSIGGVNPKKVDEILGFPSHIKTSVLLPLGVRAENSTYPKVRFSEEELFGE